MRLPSRPWAVGSIPGLSIISLALLLLTPASAKAWTYTLEDGNSKVTITADQLDGMKDWCVDGVNQLFRQWFWYRVGNGGGEHSIDTLGMDFVQQNGANGLYAEFGNNQFRIEATFILMGGAPGSGQSSIGEQLKIWNLTSDPLPFHFFQYTDFDLAGSGPGDSVELFQDSMGLFVQALQQKGNTHFADTIVSPGANHGEAGLAPGPNSLSARLADNSPTTLTDYAGPVFGDADWAFQWDRVIAPYSSVTIAVTKDLFIVPIPEPGALSLVSVGLLLFGIARRARKPR